MILTMTRPTVATPDPPHRSRLIQETGLALREDSTVRTRRGQMTPTRPRAVWLYFTFTNDATLYRLTFPTTISTATLWMQGLFHMWEPLATWALSDFASGADLWAAVKATLDAPEMDVLHRWLEEAACPQSSHAGGLP